MNSITVTKESNPMKKIRIGKVTLNIGVGEAGESLARAETVLRQLSSAKTVQTVCKVRQPTWGLRKGLHIGVKSTLRGKLALDFLKRAFAAVDNRINKKSFDLQGNFSFGIKEYIDLPGVKYDPKLGIFGLDVTITLERPGYRVKKRKLKKARIGKQHLISIEEAMNFVNKTFGVEVE